MTRRRNARDVQVNRRHGALCRHERLKTYRLPHPCGELCGARPTESERRLKGERDHAAMLAAIACNICPRKAERERRRGLGACLGVVCRLACGVVRGWRMVHLKNAHNEKFEFYAALPHLPTSLSYFRRRRLQDLVYLDEGKGIHLF